MERFIRFDLFTPDHFSLPVHAQALQLLHSLQAAPACAMGEQEVAVNEQGRVHTINIWIRGFSAISKAAARH